MLAIGIILWIGIGFIAVMVLEQEQLWGSIKKANPKVGAWFVRLCWIIFWPVLFIVYTFLGPDEQ